MPNVNIELRLQLRAVVGESALDDELDSLLQTSNFSLEAAVNAFFDAPGQNVVVTESSAIASNVVGVYTRSATVELEDNTFLSPICGLFADLPPPPPDATLADALADVLVACKAGKCAIPANELIIAIQVCDESGVDAKEHNPRAKECRILAAGIASIQLYSMEFQSGPSLYDELNAALRDKDRSKCKPLQKYIWQLMHALRDSPPFDGAVVYRGVRKDLRAMYPKGRVVTWHQFSSCTCSLEVQQSEQFCGSVGSRTLFIITVTQGRARLISSHSAVPSEAEVLLPPNTRLKVESSLHAGNGLVLVNLT